ncbi:MAG: hypothetical protein J4F37_07500 [Acidobacteria bacterium]|nr:hypothetical protein [Acidobacteriota bacterium]
MELEYVPLLRAQRELYDLPRGRERFQAYLRTMVDARTGDLELPLVAMNPMGKDHVPALLDRLLAARADGAGAVAMIRAAERPATRNVRGRYRVALVVADDAHGGWTNRHQSEFDHRFGGGALYKRGWITGILWTSEEPSAETAGLEVATAVHRLAHIRRRGPAATLEAMLAQEGEAMAAAGCREPSLDADDLAYTREMMASHLGAADRPTAIACLYGDEAARELGYRPLGFSARAGLALALDTARRRAASTGPSRE